MRFLDQFDVVLLDMNGTFMFGHDRLGPEEDFHRTYQAVGGRKLDRQALTVIMRSTCDALLSAYDDPAHFDDFPTLREAFPQYGGAPPEEIEILEQVFARHELGTCPPDHVEFLHRLAGTHRLGIVSNICAPPSAVEAQLLEAGLAGVFTHTAFSSAARSIKPSLMIFRSALAALPADSRVLFVGDSLERDIRPARELRLGTAWIAPPGAAAPEADVVIASLPDLDTLPL
ncbi:MAG TPA: HAD family hydrolase [Gemmatimonadales bacterium]